MFKSMVIPGLKCKLYLENRKSCEKANVVYLSVINEHADKQETIKYAIDEIDELFHKSGKLEHVVICGDAKIYDHVTSLKEQYGNDLDWVIPFIGDLHVLMSLEKALMKIYWSSGLSTLGKRFHKGSQFTCLENGYSHKKTQAFLLQVWEALYHQQIQQFLLWRHSNSINIFTSESITNTLFESLKHLEKAKSEHYANVEKFLESPKFAFLQLNGLQEEFDEYRKRMIDIDDTFRFGDNFIHRDCLSYIGLYIACRTGN